MSFVPLSATTPLNQYIATASQTTFPYTWLAFDEADILVYVNGTLKTLTTDYTISAVGVSTGGNVVFNSGLTAGDEVAISRSIEIKRTTGFVEAGSEIKPAALNVELNKILAIQQDNKRDQDRTVGLSVSDTTSGSLTLPVKATRASKILGFDSDGLPTAVDPNSLSPDLSGAVTDAEAAQAAAEAAQTAAETARDEAAAYPIAPWATGHDYTDGQTVIVSNIIYRCNTDHTSGATFAGDIANWDALTSSLTAASVRSFHPGRLTLTTGTPVTTSNVTAAGTLYFTPYKGNFISVYSGSEWELIEFSEISLSLSGISSGTNYDVFVYNNSGTLTLELTAWASDTARATALTTQDGVYVKTGATSRKYVGTIRASGANVSEDSLANRYVWNYYNRVLKPMQVIEATATWTYSTSSYRQANGSASNQLNFVIGVAEDLVKAAVQAAVTSSTSTYRQCILAIGLDSTTPSPTLYDEVNVNNVGYQTCRARYEKFVAAGKHSLLWLESGGGTDTQTWASNNQYGGIFGELFA